jgi:hypothetical protein
MIKTCDIGKGKNGHFFYCDACGNRIMEKGVVVFDSETGEVKHAHRGQCHNAVEKQFGRVVGWHDLSYHIYMLIHNSGYKMEDIKDPYVLMDTDGTEWEKP